jgi:hypothetical protein
VILRILRIEVGVHHGRVEVQILLSAILAELAIPIMASGPYQDLALE